MANMQVIPQQHERVTYELGGSRGNYEIITKVDGLIMEREPITAEEFSRKWRWA